MRVDDLVPAGPVIQAERLSDRKEAIASQSRRSSTVKRGG